jgi:hypothetical protein
MHPQLTKLCLGALQSGLTTYASSFQEIRIQIITQNISMLILSWETNQNDERFNYLIDFLLSIYMTIMKNKTYSQAHLFCGLFESVYILSSKRKIQSLLDFSFCFFFAATSAQNEKSMIISNDYLVKMKIIIQNIEGDNPSQQTLDKLVNLISGLKIQNYHKPFTIEYAFFIPIYLIIQSKSPSLPSSFQFLLQQCQFSELNCVKCRQADVDYLIIHHLKEKQFNYKNMCVEFNINLKELFPCLISILFSIFKVRTTTFLLHDIVLFIDPRSKYFLQEKSTDIIELLNRVSASISPHTFSIHKHKFVYQTNEFDFEKLNSGFTFYFNVFSDFCHDFIVFRIVSEPSSYSLELQIEKGQFKFLFSHQQKLSTLYISQDLPNNKFVECFFTIQPLNDETSTLYFKAQNYIPDSYTISSLHFTPKSSLYVGKSLNSLKFSFAKMGEFAFYNTPISSENFDISSLSSFKISQFFSSRSFFHISKQSIYFFSFHFPTFFSCDYGAFHLVDIFISGDHHNFQYSLSIFQLIFTLLSQSYIAQDNFQWISIIVKYFPIIFEGHLDFSLYQIVVKHISPLSYTELLDNCFKYLLYSLDIWKQGSPREFSAIVSHWTKTLVYDFHPSFQ